MKFVHDLLTLREQDTQTRIINLIAAIVIVASLGYFVYSSIIRSFDYEVDFLYFYDGGQLWSEGKNPYNYELFSERLKALAGEKFITTGYVYLPQGSVLFSTFGTFPLKEGHLVQLTANSVLTVISIFMFLYVVSWYRPIGLMEIMITVLLLNTGYGRSLRIGQLSSLVCVIILGTFILYRLKRPWWGGLVFSLLTIKPAFLPIFAVYYFLRRQYKLLIVFVIASILITLLPQVLSGRSIIDLINEWPRAISAHGGAGSLDDPSPSVPFSATLNNLQPIVFRITNSSALPASLLSWGLIAGLTLYSFYLMLRTPETPKGQFLDFALTCALSMIFIYRRNYDMFLMFPAIIYIYLHTCELATWRQRAGWIVLLVVALVVMYLPADLSLKLIGISPALNNNYLFRVIAPYQAWINVFLLLGILWLKRQSGRESVSSRVKVIQQPSVVA